MILLTAIIWLTIQQCCQVQGVSTFGRKNDQGVIRPNSCSHKTSEEKGVCMFAWKCFKQKGVQIGTCVDRFYIGSCCKLSNYVPSHVINIQPIFLNTKKPNNSISTNDPTPTIYSKPVTLAETATLHSTTSSEFPKFSRTTTTQKTNRWSTAKISSIPTDLLFWTRNSLINLRNRPTQVTYSNATKITSSFNPTGVTSQILFTTSRKQFVTNSLTKKSTTIAPDIKYSTPLRRKPYPVKTLIRPYSGAFINVSSSETVIPYTPTTPISLLRNPPIKVTIIGTTTKPATLNNNTASTHISSTENTVFNDINTLPLTSVAKSTELPISTETTSEIQNIFIKSQSSTVDIHVINTTELSTVTQEISSEFQDVFIEPIFPSLNFNLTSITEYQETTSNFQGVSLEPHHTTLNVDVTNTITIPPSPETMYEFPEVFIGSMFPIVNFAFPNTIERFPSTEISKTTSKFQPDDHTANVNVMSTTKLPTSTETPEKTSKFPQNPEITLKYPQVFIDPELPIGKWPPSND